MKRIAPTLFLVFTASIVALGQAQFVENKGQWPDQVAFRADLPAGALYAEEHAFTFVFYDPEILEFVHPTNGDRPEGDPVYSQHSYRVNFEGSSIPAISGEKNFSQHYNYYLGSDSSKWAGGCNAFQHVNYENVYPGVDLLLYSVGTSLKYDFTVKPGASVSDILLSFVGLNGLKIENGKLKIKTSIGTLTENEPFAYQMIDGKMKQVECSFGLEKNRVSFNVGEYDPAYDLVIDPELIFSTYIGSTADNFGFTACNDSQDNLISGAAVFSTGYPISLGAFQSNFNSGFGNYMDIAVSKFSADGSQLLYSTYLGGGKQETGHSLIADSNDNFILMGVTGSNDFPTTAGCYQSGFVGGPVLLMSNFFVSGHPDGTDLFITKFQNDGALAASTFVGGDLNDGLNYADKLFYNYGDAFRGEVNVDSSDNIYLASVTTGNFPTTAGVAQQNFGGGLTDGILLKMNPSLTSLLWSTYLGGNNDDATYAVEFSVSGTMIVGGGTKSSNFPHCSSGNDTSHNGDVDGYVLKMNASNGTVSAGTFAGTSGYDQVYFVQTDLDENIFCLGQTDGDMAISAGVYGQANSGQFISKFDGNLSTQLWNTTIGTGSGEIDISPTAFLVSDCRQIYFSGWGGATNGNCGGFPYTCYATSSTTFGLPITVDAFQSSTDGSDFYLCVLAEDAQALAYATFFGGDVSHEHVDGGTSRFDKNGSVYQAVCAGCGGNDDFPYTPGAWSSDNGSFNCNIGVFKFDLGGVNAELEIDGPPTICEGESVDFINNSSGATDFLWTFGDGTISTEFEPNHFYTAPDTYIITLIATDDTGCLLPDTASITIEVIPGVNPNADPVDPICEGQQAQLNATGSANLYWLPDATLSATNIPNPTALPTSTTTYYLIDFNDCETDTVPVTVVVYIPETSISPDVTICLGESTQLNATGGGTYFWTPNNTLSSPNISNPIATPTQTTDYTVTIITDEDCEVYEQVTVTVETNFPGGNIYDTLSMCYGNNAQLLAIDGFAWSWSPASSLNNPFIQDPMAYPNDTTTYFVTVTNACGEGVDQQTINVIVPHAEAFGGGTICLGNWVSAWATGGVDYTWQPVAWASEPHADSTLLSPPESMAIIVNVIDQYGCGDQDSVYVFVLPLPEVDAGPDQHIEYLDGAELFGYTNWDNFTWWPQINMSCTDCLSPWVYPDVTMYYHLTATDHNGCSATDSALVKLYFPLYVPNTITPNGDGINDYFRAYGIDIEGFHMQIFDRWGDQIFESYDIEEVWDGGIKDYFVQNDSYVWYISYNSIDRRKELVGHVNVIR